MARKVNIMLASTALLCLTLNIYHEAKGEPKIGKHAVAHVTLNRAEDKSKVCSTVYAKHQFSWTKKRNKKVDTSSDAWKESKTVAQKALTGRSRDPTNGATHFHATRVKPKWRHKLERTTKIGNHVFYK